MFRDKKANAIFNDYGNFKEIIIYKNSFSIPENTPLKPKPDRKFFYENGILKPKTQTETLLEDLQQSLIQSRKRTLDKIYSYILSNPWQYFITLTFKQCEEFNRFNLDDVNYCWKIFRKKLQRKFPDITIILIPENHPTSGAIHFHGLLGNCNLKNFLTPAINQKQSSPHYGEPLKTKFGAQIYNFNYNFYKYGFSTIVEINDQNNKRLANYLAKYISKDLDTTNIRYNKKSYYCTRNLLSKEKIVCLLSEDEINEILNKRLIDNLKISKENEKFIILTYEKSNKE